MILSEHKCTKFGCFGDTLLHESVEKWSRDIVDQTLLVWINLPSEI